MPPVRAGGGGIQAGPIAHGQGAQSDRDLRAQRHPRGPVPAAASMPVPPLSAAPGEPLDIVARGAGRRPGSQTTVSPPAAGE